ncbi:alpha/beta hydrolase [Geodermatophilus chilensis]|uniref:alpha/beta hydrolase n=1 Tax=Geodermatophilus chilensis TaxID=2035835 RepID=UPI000C26586A|nr:alpha/beta hydrolase [Geodermatophilus chilensis]
MPELTWAGCGTTAEATAAGVECATADLPMDHAEPGGTRVQIAVARVPAADPANRIGSLFFNFGGPGGPAVDYLQAAGPGVFAALNQRFDIVGFDPRGVGQSTPAVDCGLDPQSEGFFSPPAPTPFDVDPAALVASAQEYVDACLANNGEVLEHLSTANVARDMDLLRAAVGDERLTYLGFSYGTFLGATYAALFPDRYRALVLDGALDPEQYLTDPVSLSTAQAAGFERALDRFAEACAVDQPACSGFGGPDPLLAYDRLLAAAEAAPIPAPGYPEDPRPVTADEIREVTLTLLYAKQLWGLLAAALAAAEDGDASAIRALADHIVYADPASTDRFFAISAGEQQWPTDVDAYLERGAAEWAAFPHFWGSFAYSEIPWGLWPVQDEDAFTGPYELPGTSATPLVIGTTHDPATPYSGSVAMVEALGNARLLTMEGDGHTAYGGNSACIDSVTDAYLVDGALPAAGTVCQQEVPVVAPTDVPVEASTATQRLAVPLAG